MVFTSKTLIPGKQPIGQNKDGSYIYDGVQSPNMSVMPSKGTYDTSKQMSVVPKVWTPPTPVPMVKSPVGFNLMPKVDPTTASKVNAPVEDVKGILQVDKTDPRIQKLEQHFKTLKQKGQLQLNQKQTEYVQRYKKNLPQYANVPDALLFGRIIMKYPEAQEKYGNIGQKGVVESIVGLPLAMAKTGSDAIMEAQDVFAERQQTLNKGSNLGITNLLASASAGRALGTGAMGMAGDVLNVASPLINPETGVTSITEGLGRDIGTMIEKVPEEYRQQISDLIVKYPKITATLGTAFDLSNLIPFLGVLGKAKSTAQVDDILRQVKTSTSLTLVPGEILPGLKTAGKNLQKTITPNIISKDVATLRADRIEKGLRTQNNNLGKSVGKSYSNNTKTYTLDNGTKQTVTPIDTFKKYGIEPEVVDKTIKMGDFKNVREGGLGKIQDNIETIGDEITGTLKSTGKKISTEDYKKRVIEAAKKNDDLKRAGKVSETIKKIENKFDDYKESYGDEIDITEVDEIRKVSNRDWSPDTEDVSSLIGDVGRDIVYNSTDDMYVRDLLREQGNLLAARKYAISLNGTKVRGGRLGDLISGGAGAAVGAIAGMAIPIPIVGPAIGAAAGQKAGTTLSKLFSSTQFKSPTAEFKGLFSKSGGVESPSIKVQRVPKVSTKSIEPPKATIKSSSSTVPSGTSVESNMQKLLPMPQKPQVESGKSSILSQLSKEKSKSAGKKVTPIIQKLKEKKNNIVEGLKKAKVDTELESLQKIQESMPGVPSIEVPKDYTPIGGLPTGTEFEAPIISSISKTKGKLPSPDVKRPQIRGFDLSTRSSMLESLKEQGMFTDSFFVVKDKNVSNKLFEYAEKKAIKKGNPTSGTKVDMKALVERAENGADTLLTPKEYMKLGKENGVYLRMDIGNGNQVAVNASYADIFFKNFDDVTFKGNNELSPVVVLSKGEPVGVIMPIKDVYSLKGKLGDFSMQSKTPQVEGKTVDRIKEKKTEVKANLPKTPMKTEKTSETLLNEYDSIKKEIDSLRENAMKKIKNGEDTGDLIPRIKELQTKEESIYNEYKSKRNIEEGLDESNRKIESDKVIEDKKITEMKKSEETDLRGFTDNMSPMEKGKAISLLTNKRVMYKGKAMTLRDAFEKKLEDGWKLSDNGLIFRNPEYLSHTVDVGTPVNKTESAYIKYISKSDTPKTPQVEGKTVEKIKAMQLEQEDMIRKGESISDDFRTKWNDLQSQYKKEFIDSRIASEKRKVDSAISEIKAKAKSNPDRAEWAKNQIEMEEEGFNNLKKGDYFEKKYQEHIKTIREEAKKSSLLKSIKDKPKPFLPLSQKLEVKYSKPDTLVQEARKYDYANGFISDYYKKPNILNWGGPETLEGGLPKIKQRGALFLAENSTDGKNYAEGYAKLSSLTGKSKVHQIELDETAKIFDIRNKKDRELLKSKLDEYTYSQLNKRGKAIDWKEIEPIISDIKSLGYDGVIVLERPKGHILDGANGKYKSMADINSVAIFNPDKIKKAKTNSELLDIYNKANKSKSSLPMSAKSEVKYSKPDTLVQEARKYKSAEDYIKAQGEPVYHGGVDIVGGRPFLKQAKTVKGDGTTSDSSMLFFSDKKEVADFFAENRKMIKKGNSEVIQGTLDRSKILNFGGTNETFGKALSNLGYDIKTLKVKNGDITNLFDDKAFTDKLREKGYNGISISEKGGTTFGIIDDNVFKNRTENLYEYSKYIADTADKKLLPNAKNYSTPEDYAEGLNYARKNPIGRTANSLGGEVSIGKPSTKEGLMVMGDGTHTVIKIGDNEIYVKGDMEGSTYYLSNIYINNKGTGLGTKFMEKLKESADIYGFDITISKVSNQNFFDKFNWLKGNSYKSETSFSHTKQQLLDIYNKANKK